MLVVTALACCVVATAHVIGESVPWSRLIIIGVLYAAATVPLIEIRVGSDNIAVTWSGAALAAGATLLAGAWIVLVVALCGIWTYLKQRDQRVKAVFNIAMDVTGAGLAVLIAGWASPLPIKPDSAMAVLALTLATLAVGIWSDAATTLVISLSQRRSFWSVYRAGLGTQLISEAGNLIAALAVVAIVRLDPRAVVIVPALVLCLRQAYLDRLRGREERTSWQRLMETTRSLSELDDDVVLTRAVTTTAGMFSVDSVEVELTGGRLLRGDEEEVGYDGPAADAPERVATTVVERRLGGDTAPVGVLRLCFRGKVTLRDRERAMLGAVAAELHSALVNAAQHAKAKYEASHDPLTGLLNRAGLLAAGSGWMTAAAESDVDSALVLIDLTGFREIIDTLGHAAGDAILVHTARRLTAAAMPGELVARLDGDDFVVLLPKLTDATQANARTEALLGALAAPTDIDGAALPVSGVAGIAYSVRGSVRLEELLRQAGVAVHAVRSSGGRIQYYAPERDVRSVSRVVLASELRAALRGMDELDLLYQPILDLHTGEAVSAEALIRWDHPTRGMLPPDEFLPVVEHAGLLPELTGRVFDIALRNAASWSRQGINVPVSVNVSPRTLLDRDFPGQVAAALSRHRVPAERVTLEITETSVLSHLTVVDLVLDELRDLGVRLSLDDFGTGWSSLSHLARVPVHEVKIAATFTERILSSPQAAAVVRGTLEIGRALDLRVVAEGVTGAIQRATLISLGAHAGQGMYFFPPLSADRIGAALWSSSVRAAGTSNGADVIPLSKRRSPHG